MRCPTEEVIAAFARGELGADDRDAVEVHIDGCSDCARVVTDLVRIYAARTGELPDLAGSTTEVSATVDTDQHGRTQTRPLLAAGSQVGRYRVLECVGVGGMGAVYAAYDPDLDRRIALKLLRSGGHSPADRERNRRLLREAQALARLSHPNVITVHDVGTFDDRVFVAMEFVSGSTLKQWIKAGPHPWGETRDVFVAAGQGLAAAHAAGLVHRDFKPDNVLIGRSGRVRVTDFGLARIGQPRAAQSAYELRMSLSNDTDRIDDGHTLTRTGELVGTPAYMAPEQWDGSGADEKSDQFSFCVALFEALYGERPFAGKSVAELSHAVLAGSMRAPRCEARAPMRVRRAVIRGLSRNPDERFETMDALVAILARRPSRTLRRLATATVPAVVLGLGLWSYQSSSAPRAGFCSDDQSLEGLWGPSQREAMQASFSQTGVPYAETTFESVRRALDGWAERWTMLRDETCGLDADVPDARVSLRTQCLSDQRARFSALVDLLRDADAELVRRSAPAVEALPDPGECADTDGLSATRLLMPAPAQALQQRLAKVSALLSAGRYDTALELAQQIRKEAADLDYPPILAEAMSAEGQLLAKTGELDASIETLHEAAWLAVEGRHHLVAARAWAQLAFLYAEERVDLDQARQAIRAARAEAKALGGEPKLERMIAMNVGAVAHREGRYADARRAFAAALQMVDPSTEPVARADILFNLGAIEAQTGSFEAAIEHFREYLDVYRTHVGDTHPAVAMGHFNLAAALERMERLPEAREQLEAASSIELLTLGEDHPTHARTIGALGAILTEMGELEEALEYIDESIELLQRSSSNDALAIADQRLSRADVLIRLGRADEAAPLFADAWRQLTEIYGEDHPQLLGGMIVSARLHRARGELEAAQRDVERIVAARRETVGDVHPYVANALVDLAEVQLDRGDDKAATATLRTLLDEFPTDQIRAPDRVWAEFLRARLHYADDPDRAQRLAEQVRAESTRTADRTARIERMNAWLHQRENTRSRDANGAPSTE